MAIDYSKMVKASVQNTESDSLRLPEGESLVMLVAVDRSFPAEIGSVSVDVYAGKKSVPNMAFGRSVVTFDQELCKTPEFIAAYGEPVPDPCPIAGHVKTLSAEEQKNSKLSRITLWVACVVGARMKGAKPSTPWTPCYTKPKWLTAKTGGKSTHIQGELDRLFSTLEPEDVAKIFDRRTAQLLVINRKGTEFATTYTVTRATGEDPSFGDLSNWEVPNEIVEDIEKATVPGGPCDLITVVASVLAPKMPEIQKKLFGEDEEQSE